MTGEADAADLIRPLIEGMVEDPLWATFLARLRERTGADYASLVFRPLPFGPEGNRVIHLHAGQAWPDVLSRQYHDSQHVDDPLPYRQMVDGRVYALPELLHFDDPDHESYFRQFLVPSGMTVLRMLRVAEASGVSAWLTVSRRTGEFAGVVDALLADVSPYLRAALRSHVAMERERLSASVANEAIRRMNCGWLTLDRDGRVLDGDAHGSALLADSNLLSRDRSGRLTARDPAMAREIATGIAAIVQSVQAGQPRPRAIVLSREPWLDMLLVAANLHAGTSGPAPALVAYVHADDWSSADRCDQIAQLFDLVPSEARLALALSRGMSIAEAATDLGITTESARTYSKRIYAKTGARGQVDLVRFIHRSVLAIA